MPIHIAITRRVHPGREAEFQAALREFFQSSFAHGGVLGATMISPAPGTDSREFGIVRTFADEKERDDFYAAPAFKDWERRIAPLVESHSWTHQPLHGLEAWFRSSHNPPPKWKMALLTWIAVWPVSMSVSAVLHPLVHPHLPQVLVGGVISAGIVIVLSWVAMPLLVKIAHKWLHGSSTSKTTADERG